MAKTTTVWVIMIAFMSFMGCAASGTRGKLKNLSRSDSKAIQQVLFDNWSDYNIWIKAVAIVFDPKDDNKTILVNGRWRAVTDQETWNKVAENRITSRGDFIATGSWGGTASMTGVREIWGPDNQLYGYIIHLRADLVSTSLVAENKLRLFYHIAPFGP